MSFTNDNVEENQFAVFFRVFPPTVFRNHLVFFSPLKFRIDFTIPPPYLQLRSQRLHFTARQLIVSNRNESPQEIVIMPYLWRS